MVSPLKNKQSNNTLKNNNNKGLSLSTWNKLHKKESKKKLDTKLANRNYTQTKKKKYNKNDPPPTPLSLSYSQVWPNKTQKNKKRKKKERSKEKKKNYLCGLNILLF